MLQFPSRVIIARTYASVNNEARPKDTEQYARADGEGLDSLPQTAGDIVLELFAGFEGE